MKIRVGSLVQIQHFHSMYNGKIGYVIRVCKRPGFRDSYAIRVPTMTYEMGLIIEQLKVLA